MIRKLLGPELYWVLVYLAAVVVARRNSPPTEAGSRFLEMLAWRFPVIVVPLSFIVYALPDRPRWLAARVLLAALVGFCFVSVRLINGIDYGDSRNSGVLGIFSNGMLVLFGTLILSFIVLWIVR
jgi:hypothetical protein